MFSKALEPSRNISLGAAALAGLLLTAACKERPVNEDLEDRITELEEENASLRDQLSEANARIETQPSPAPAHPPAYAMPITDDRAYPQTQRLDEGEADERTHPASQAAAAAADRAEAAAEDAMAALNGE